MSERARGSQQYGLLASSKARRQRPYAIDNRVGVNPVQWLLKDPGDVRSSWYLEDCATDFQVQGLELDWACVTRDGDSRGARAGERVEIPRLPRRPVGQHPQPEEPELL